MIPLLIKPTKFSPKIQFYPEKILFEISGFSLPENVSNFYAPVVQWLDEYIDWYKVNKEHISKKFKASFNLTYFNSGSLRFFINIIKKIVTLQELKVEVQILWYFDRDDIEIKDSGVEISDIVNFPFEFVEK